MTDTRDIRSVVEAAEQAAAAGDYASAEQLLTEVARLQEASLGPLHPDLANTLNNLGIVCEITEKFPDAERHFRSAYAIATAALAPDHPFVATSRKNLEDFCKTRGIVVHEPPPPPTAPSPVVVEAKVQAAPPATPTRHEELPRPAAIAAHSSPVASAPPRVAARGWSGPVVVGSVIAGAAIVALLVAAPWHSTSVSTGAPNEVAPERHEPIAAVPKAEEPAPTTSAPAAATPAIAPPPVVPPPAVPPPVVKSPPIRTAPSKPPEVATAQLCETLSTGGDWRCVTPSVPVNPGPIYFYSRLKSATDTTVQHRWYRGDRLRRAVSLRILANRSGGYRTYSRQTVDSVGSADWRVELRASDGALLHEERFVVR